MSAESRYQFLPSLSDEEFTALKADIAERGVLVPVVTDENGNVLDGVHRRRAVEELRREGVTVGAVPTSSVFGLDEDGKVTHGLVTNLKRRMLRTEQLRAVALRLDDERHWTARRIASVIGVNHETVSSWLPVQVDISVGEIPPTDMSTCTPPVEVEPAADTVIRNTGKDGKSYRARKPTTVQAKSEREAERARLALRDTPSETLPAGVIIDSKRAERIGRETHAAEVRAAPVEIPEMSGVDLRHGDFRRVLADLPDESVDLIFTDPPYPQEFNELWSDLSLLAARVLKPGALLIAYSGQTFLPEVLGRLSEHLTYLWLGSIVTPGTHWQSWRNKVRCGCKPLLFFARGVYQPVEWFDDTYTSEGEEKEHHDWQQSVGCARSYIERLTRPGDVVLDPFLGGGTTAIAAKALARHIVGCDVDAAALTATIARLAGEDAA